MSKRPRKEAPAKKGLKIKLGRNVEEPGGFVITLDGEDITERLPVRSIDVRVSADPPLPLVRLEVYVGEIELDAGTVEIVEKIRRCIYAAKVPLDEPEDRDRG